MKRKILFSVAVLLIFCLIGLIFYLVDKSVFVPIKGIKSLVVDILLFTIPPLAVTLYPRILEGKTGIKGIVIEEIFIISYLYTPVFFLLFFSDIPLLSIVYRMILVIVLGTLAILGSLIFKKDKV
jgi:hypothetical protein